MTHARAAGYTVVDLQPAMAERHAADGTRFEYPLDNHWSGAGHALAAGAVSRVPWMALLLDGRTAE